MAKKYHPDMLDTNEDRFEALEQEMFKAISEAYTVLSNKKSREEYDKLIMGDFLGRDSQRFYDPTQTRSKNEESKMKNYDTDRSYEEIFNRYDNHREAHKVRTRARTAGWEDLNYKNPDNSRFYKYNIYKRGTSSEHFDTKENHDYYSQPISSRARQNLKPQLRQMMKDIFSTKPDDDLDDDHPRPA
eukprot:CAMPEP_0196998538 /NCGR_PEP_ID=MMETSP1380-20130617/3904_1 /TAXON_ID=5936 /ORGANISM="Euplotes crassus, Strain CT5" /LENGTH=186 /DNA_ID=CAMNT_0042415143 /DNA_START=167 /DNA_END=727 /DNA_ORIENTATION=+